MSKCVGFKGLLLKLQYNKKCQKGASKNLGRRMPRSKGGPSTKRPKEKLHVHEPKVEKQNTKKTKLPFYSDEDTTTIVGSICEIITQALTSFHILLHAIILKALTSSKTQIKGNKF
jgi:hypothetical protein